MRLTCPNCGAQYEVDSGMIPDEGRDVQCSNCGHTWFQMPEGQMSVPNEAPAAEQPVEPDTTVTDEPTKTETAPHEEHQDEHVKAEQADEGEQPEYVQDVGHEAEIETPELTTESTEQLETPEESALEASEEHGDGDGESYPAPSSVEEELQAHREALEEDSSEQHDHEPSAEDQSSEVEAYDEEASDKDATEDEAGATSDEAPPPREVDAAVLGILREEAEREVAARRQERGEALETQTDMGLSEAAKPYTPLDDTVGDATTAEDGLDDQVDPPGSRSDLLPDVEEINSSLRPADQHEDGVGPDDPVAQEENKRMGFRTGFVAIVTVAAILVLAYLFAPQIVQAVPAAEPVVIIYLNAADSARASLDNVMARSVEGLSGLLANMSGEDGN